MNTQTMKLTAAYTLLFRQAGDLSVALLMATWVVACTTSDRTQTHACPWVASWTASPQPVWNADFAFPTGIPPALENQTVRQVARISLGGRRLRLVFSNAYGTLPLNIDAVTVALSDVGSEIQPH